MSWPKKNTRTVHVRHRPFLWHLDDNFVDSDSRITIGTEAGKYFLFLDPFDHDLEIAPSMIARAVVWASDQGWSPDDGPSRGMGFDSKNQSFFWLPDEFRFAHERPEAST